MFNVENSVSNEAALLEDSVIMEALSAMDRAIRVILADETNSSKIEEAIWLMYHTMLSLFAEQKMITMGAFRGKISINQKFITTKKSALKQLETQLVRLRITHLQIKRNVSKKELTQLVHLLTLHDADAFSTGIRKATLSHITIPTTRCKTLHLEQVVAFLKGDIESTNESLNNELATLATNPDRLGQLLIESAALLQQQDYNEARPFKHLVIECLRRAFDGIRRQPRFSETIEGIEAFKKSLLRLQNSLCKKIAEQTGHVNPEIDTHIEKELQIMHKELDFSLHIQTFLQQHKTLCQSREKIKEFLHSQDPEMIEELLEHGTFQAEDWHHILHGDELFDSSEPLETPKALEMLEHFLEEEKENPQPLSDFVAHSAPSENSLASSSLTRRFSLHKKEPPKEMGTIGGQSGLMNRKELLFSISEVAQELMQPLTAMNAALEMLSGGYVGDVTPEQQKILLLAYNSGDHLRHLMDELISIVGFPTSTGTDKRFHTTSDEVARRQQNNN